MGEGEQFQDLGIVVEHLFEMRHMPLGVDRVAGEAAAEVVVNAALAESEKKLARRGASLLVAVAERLVPKKAKNRRMGEFWRAAEPAMNRVDLPDVAGGEARQVMGPKTVAWFWRGKLAEESRQILTLRDEVSALLGPSPVHRVKNLSERR